jgi:sugar lactone lactonase YvrE
MTALVFGESPRWHDGRLWFSDMGANEVARCKYFSTSPTVTPLSAPDRRRKFFAKM